MNTTAAKSVTVGQHIATIPSRESGLRTRLSGTVTEVEAYEIMGSQFVDLKMAAEHLTLTVSADSLVEVAA